MYTAPSFVSGWPPPRLPCVALDLPIPDSRAEILGFLVHETAPPPSRASPVVQRPHPFHWVLNLPTLTRLPKGIFWAKEFENWGPKQGTVEGHPKSSLPTFSAR